MIANDLQRLAADEITLEILNELVAQETTEGFTLEYKRELGNGRNVLMAVVAMANTWGGLILVGIDEQPERGTGFGAPGPDGIVGVPAGDRSRLVNMCSTRLVPPFDPVVFAIALAEGNVVLAVKVYADLAPRPVTFEDRVLVRTDAGSRPADLFRLRQLFSESRSAVITGNAGSVRIPMPHNHAAFTEEPQADFILRATAAIPLLPSSSRPKLTDAVRQGVQQAMSQARISAWLGNLLTRAGAGNLNINPWLVAGLSTSSRAEFRWEGFPFLDAPECVFPEAQLGAELPPNLGGGPSTRVDLHLDVIIRTTALAGNTEIPPLPAPRLSLDDLFFLFEAVAETFATTLPVAIQNHIGVPTGGLIGPRIGLTTNNGRPISDVIDTRSLQVVRGSQQGAGGELARDPELNWLNPDDRRRQAVEWMRELLLDLHFMNVDQAIDRIVH